VPGRREVRLLAAAERRRGTPAVRLVADDHDGRTVSVGSRPHVFRCRPWRETLVDLGLAERERGRRLAGAQQRAADHGVRRDPLGTQPLAEPPRLLAALGRERAQLVGVSRRSLGVSDDHEAHRGQDNLAHVDDLWERYLLLGLRLGRHVDGLVDAYFGPPGLQERVDAEPLTRPAELADEAGALSRRTQSSWLRAQLVGCETTARRLDGEPIAWSDEVERCYGVRPEHTDESQFVTAHEQLDRALPGGDDLAERYRAWIAGQALPADALLQASARFADALRTRTAELFGLPDHEEARIELVTDEPWGAFNYYLGGHRSRVVINTDLPVYSFRLPELIAHEIYPGHHTEHAWKESLLVDGDGNYGEAIFLVGTPQSTVSEGIASLAPEIVGAFDATPGVYADLGVPYDAATADAVREAREALDTVSVNAALFLHEQGASRDEAVAYLERWSLVPRDLAEKNVDFITHPTWRAYVSCYSSGYALCKRWVDGDAQRFRRLLTEQLTTGDLQ
jgi:hypothetical protein